MATTFSPEVISTHGAASGSLERSQFRGKAAVTAPRFFRLCAQIFAEHVGRIAQFACLIRYGGINRGIFGRKAEYAAFIDSYSSCLTVS